MWNALRTVTLHWLRKYVFTFNNISTSTQIKREKKNTKFIKNRSMKFLFSRNGLIEYSKWLFWMECFDSFGHVATIWTWNFRILLRGHDNWFYITLYKIFEPEFSPSCAFFKCSKILWTTMRACFGKICFWQFQIQLGMCMPERA